MKNSITKNPTQCRYYWCDIYLSRSSLKIAWRYALCFRSYRSFRSRKVLPLGSLYLPGRFMYTCSLHGTMRNAPLMSNWYSIRFSCAAIAQIVRMILTESWCWRKCLTIWSRLLLPASAFARARHSVVLPSLSHFTLNERQVFMTLQPSGMVLVLTIWFPLCPYRKSRSPLSPLPLPIFLHQVYQTLHCSVLVLAWSPRIHLLRPRISLRSWREP